MQIQPRIKINYYGILCRGSLFSLPIFKILSIVATLLDLLLSRNILWIELSVLKKSRQNVIAFRLLFRQPIDRLIQYLIYFYFYIYFEIFFIIKDSRRWIYGFFDSTFNNLIISTLSLFQFIRIVHIKRHRSPNPLIFPSTPRNEGLHLKVPRENRIYNPLFISTPGKKIARLTVVTRP